MYYQNYVELSSRYKHFQAVYDDLCGKRERLRTAALPHGTRLDGCKVSGSGSVRAIEDSVIRIELSQIEAFIQEANTILDGWDYIKRRALEDLRKSSDIHDRVFYYKYVKGHKVEWIAAMIGLSESQVYRIMQKIQCDRDNVLPPSLEKPG